MKRMLATVAVAVSLVAFPSTAMAAGPSTGAVAASPADPDTVTIGGRTYGPADGLKTTRGEVTLPRTGGITAASPTVFYFGSSFASTEEFIQFRYVGQSYAAGNVTGGQRVIRVCHKYTRDGRDLFGFTCSNASSSGGSWRAGGIVTKGVNDSLNPRAPQTKFAYNTSRVDPRIF